MTTLLPDDLVVRIGVLEHLASTGDATWEPAPASVALLDAATPVALAVVPDDWMSAEVDLDGTRLVVTATTILGGRTVMHSVAYALDDRTARATHPYDDGVAVALDDALDGDGCPADWDGLVARHLDAHHRQEFDRVVYEGLADRVRHLGATLVAAVRAHAHRVGDSDLVRTLDALADGFDGTHLELLQAVVALDEDAGARTP